MNDWVRETYETHRRLLFRVAWLVLRRGDLAEDGVKLDIGKPIVTTTSIQTTLAGRLGEASVISIDSARGGRVLISAKVIDIKDSKNPFRSKGAKSSPARKR